MPEKNDSPVFQKVYEIVSRVPKGKVTTYGTISRLMSKRLSAQGVGWALNALPEAAQQSSKHHYNSSNVPWHRVVNARGRVSTNNRPDMPEDQQRRMLEAEGIEFDRNGSIEQLESNLWQPD